MLANGTKITELAWETTVKILLLHFSMILSSEWVVQIYRFRIISTRLSTVFSSQNIIVNLGWNTYQLTNAYEWDGISDLIIEVCYDNTSQNYTRNWSTPYTVTSFNSSVYYRSDVNNACNTLTATSTSVNRPVTRFTTCDIQPNLNDFSFQWYINNQLDTNTAQSPSFSLYDTSLIKVICTNVNGGCTDSATLTIDVFCDTCFKPIPTLTPPTCRS